jgi:hypothetical protein
MSNSLIPAFNQIRLTNSFVSVSGERVKVSNDNTLMVRDSGNFANVQSLTGLSGYLMGQIGFAAGGVTSINGISGSISVAGTGNISAHTIGQSIYISGNSNDALNLSGYIDSVSGGLEARIRATGQAAWTAGQNNALNISGNLTQTGVRLITSINTLSGNLTTTGQTLVNLINGLSGQLNLNNYISYINATGFVTGVVVGSDYQYIHFPRAFSRTPMVQLTMDTISDTGNIYYFCGTSKRTTTGFFANFSDTIQETGLVLSVWASI